jgi:hypothetical protein
VKTRSDEESEEPLGEAPQKTGPIRPERFTKIKWEPTKQINVCEELKEEVRQTLISGLEKDAWHEMMILWSVLFRDENERRGVHGSRIGSELRYVAETRAAANASDWSELTENEKYALKCYDEGMIVRWGASLMLALITDPELSGGVKAEPPATEKARRISRPGASGEEELFDKEEIILRLKLVRLLFKTLPPELVSTAREARSPDELRSLLKKLK